MAELIIRSGVPSDVDDMEILEQRCFSVPWSRESILYDLSENHLAAYFVAELSGRVVGDIGVWKIVDEGHITNVAVSRIIGECRLFGTFENHAGNYGRRRDCKAYFRGADRK